MQMCIHLLRLLVILLHVDELEAMINHDLTDSHVSLRMSQFYELTLPIHLW